VKEKKPVFIITAGIFGGKKEDFCQPYKSMNVNTDFIYEKHLLQHRTSKSYNV
jgi:hypothetical protein